jgi:poly(A) polymerase
LLKGVAAERVRDELFRTLAAPGCGASLRRLGVSGLWPEISPVPALATIEERIPLAEEAERLGSEADLAIYLDHEVEGGVNVRSLIKLAAFLGSSEKDRAAVLAERLRLGRKAGRILELLCRDEGRIYERLERIGSERPMFRFFRDREPAGPGMLIIARSRGEISESRYFQMLDYYLEEYDPEVPDLFLQGSEIMKILDISPGKSVGEAMECLRYAEASGLVNDRDEAKTFIKNLLTKEDALS